MTLDKLKYSPGSNKLVGARTAVCSSPTRRGLPADSVAALFARSFVFASLAVLRR